MSNQENAALITGSTSGIGFATAKALATRGWHVIVHGRNEARCREAAEALRTATGHNAIDHVATDLADLKQVADLANAVGTRFPGLNVLILNAGTFSKSRIMTRDGLEQTWVVNYLSRFLLTHLLLPVLEKNAPARIIDVSGMYHKRGRIHFEDIHLDQGYSLAKANDQSKLANVLFTQALSHKLDGHHVTINTLHPGAVNTGSVLRSEDISPLMKAMYRLMSVFFKSPEQGAETPVYLATSPDLEGVSGKYFVNKKVAAPARVSSDKVLQDQLWELSVAMIEEKTGICL